MTASTDSQPITSVFTLPDADGVASVVAERLVAWLLERSQPGRAGEPVHLVLTGGRIGIAALARLAKNPLSGAVTWDRFHLWWGDERFLPPGHPDRNETQARAALLKPHPDLPDAKIHPTPARGADRQAIPPRPGILAANFHPIPALGAQCQTPDDAARVYAESLAALARPGQMVPAFDLVLLGMGPDGHIASLFPGLGQDDLTEPSVVGVENAPKPPPQRVSLTLPALNSAAQVWIGVGGSDKAPALARALARDQTIPAGRICGRQRTLWFCDQAARGGDSPPGLG